MNKNAESEKQKEFDANFITIISKDGKSKGQAYEDDDLTCEIEGCNGTQYVVKWQDGTSTNVCGKGLKWLNGNTAKIMD